jgi:hypothetical protein
VSEQQSRSYYYNRERKDRKDAFDYDYDDDGSDDFYIEESMRSVLLRFL